MKNLLQINTSIFTSNGVSTQLANLFVSTWLAKHPEDKLVLRDLAANPLPHMSAQRFAAFTTPVEQRTPEQQVFIAESDQLIAELKLADIIILGLPMYNFGIPSTLKAYIDQIARAGQTFRYTENGPVGLLENKKTYIFATRGGYYSNSTLDTETSYIRDILGFMGISDIDFVYAEGLNIGESQKLAAISNAEQQLATLVN